MIRAIDVFAGGGGATAGLLRAGIQVVAAINHNPIALHSHAINHPNTKHFCEDAFLFDPRNCPETDMITLSPECRKHSLGDTRSSDNTNQPSLWTDELPDTHRSRATMSICHRYAQVLNPRLLCVENIVNVVRWPGFKPWLESIVQLGYKYRLLSLNAAHCGVPQNRDRFIGVFWKDIPDPDLDPRPMATCNHCMDRVHTYQRWKRDMEFPIGYWRRQYNYCCSRCNNVVIPDMPSMRNILDWTLPAPTIKERAQNGKPLAAATLARIQRGLHHPKTKRSPFVAAYYSGSDVFASIDDPLPTVTTHDRHLLVIPDSSYNLDNCQVRLLDLSEIRRAMNFEDTHIFVGNKAQILRQLGNAVPPGMMHWLGKRVIPALS